LSDFCGAIDHEMQHGKNVVVRVIGATTIRQHRRATSPFTQS
jgi:hypothetical protein